MQTVRYEIDDTGVATMTFDAPGEAVNTMSAQWLADLGEVVDGLERDRARLRGVLLASAKSTFFAGAELHGVLQLRETDAPAVFERVQAVKRSFRRLETLGRPVVALLAGSALGGGWELALAAHARFALDDAKIQFGTPEVTLGLIPGATGITKTVRMLGLTVAQPYLLEGKLFHPRDAAALGWVQGLGDSVAQLERLARAWIDQHPDAIQPWDRKGYAIPGGTPGQPKVDAALVVAPAMLLRQTRGLYPAAQAILECMVEGARVDYDTATRIESRKLAQVMVGQTTKNMVTAFFFNMNAIRGGAFRPRGVARWQPRRVGVLGAGMMGAGIAHAVASRGMTCVLKDVDLDKARRGVEAVHATTAGLVRQGRLDEAAQAALLNRIIPTAQVSELRDCELIIEAVSEQRALKAQVTREAEPMLADDGIFASNTSTLPITGLAQASSRPERFVGLHFFSPVHKMRLVEIIRGARTDDETVARAYDVVTALGKVAIVVNDSRGFFTSRVFGAFVMEGAAMLAEGIPAPLIEHAALAAGMPVGPLAALDETSLALSVQVMAQTRADLKELGQASPVGPGEQLVERMVKELHRAGRAAGAGFYDYPAGQSKLLWPQLAQLFERAGTMPGVQSLSERLLYRQSIEAARCLSEGVLNTVEEANIGSLLGIGFPAWTGGAIQFIAAQGRARFLATADALAAAHGSGYALSARVRDAVGEWCP